MKNNQNQLPPPPQPLYKQKSWSPETYGEEVWRRRKGSFDASNGRPRSNKSVTDDDLEELKACVELGFGFGPDSPDLDPKLSHTLPALRFFCDVNKLYSNELSRSSSSNSLDSESSTSTISSIIDPGDDSQMVKSRLKQWAQVVACSVLQSAGKRPN